MEEKKWFKKYPQKRGGGNYLPNGTDDGGELKGFSLEGREHK